MLHSQCKGPEVETDVDVMQGVEEQRGDEGVEGTTARQVGPQRLMSALFPRVWGAHSA